MAVVVWLGASSVGAQDRQPAASGASGAEATQASTPTAGSPTTSAEVDAGTYAVRLRDLEQRINELKEQIFRSKARLSLLAETILQGVVAGAQAVIVHENRMSSTYRLVKATYALDGAPIFNRADEGGDLGQREQFEVYNGNILPGEHTLTVNLEYRGHGFGVFEYLKGHRFKVRSSYSFTAPEGRSVTIRVVGYEKGGPTAPLEERPAIRYVERVSDRLGAQGASAPGAGTGGGAGGGGE
ncbi:MAG: dihydrolipoamide acetyltransferase [Myxococcota bacterium]|nr:dihydrolipoamide acetyltransferase [Myxococcota bacterium]MDW8362671.1 dihydrolipoamide acetyltransferase [Myxococcales bacterium]